MKQLLKWSSGGGAKRICQNKYGGFDGLRAFAAIGIAMMHYLANITYGDYMQLPPEKDSIQHHLYKAYLK